MVKAVTTLAALAAALLLCLSGPAGARAADFPATLTDAAGREVTVPAEPRRVVLAEGLQFLSLALVHEDPAGVLALIGDDLRTFDPATYDGFAAHLPKLAAVPTLGARGGLSLETVLAAEPDLVLLSLWQEPQSRALVDQMQAAGVPVVFTDFYMKPRENTARSIRILGRALGRTERAEAFAAFYEAHLAAVEEALAGVSERPATLLQHFAGAWPCCWSAGTGSLGAFLDLAKADNIGASRLPTANGGNLSLEYILSANPSLFIATGLGRAPGGLAVGSGIEAAEARASLARLAAQPGLSAIDAVARRRVHGLWNSFNGSPLNILAIEAIATWAHPDRCKAIHPDETLAAINARFLSASPLTGTFWTSLDAGAGPQP